MSLLEARGVRDAPEEWTAVDSLAVLKVFGWQLGANVDEELGRALTVAAVGTDRADDLTPAYPVRGHEAIVTGGAVVGKAFDPDASFVVDPHRLHHKNPVTPYAGTELTGVVQATWLRGRPVTGDAPAGRFLIREDA